MLQLIRDYKQKKGLKEFNNFLFREIAYFKKTFDDFSERGGSFTPLLGGDVDKSSFTELELSVIKARDEVRESFVGYTGLVKTFLDDLEGEIIAGRYDRIALSCRATIEELAVSHFLILNGSKDLQKLIILDEPFAPQPSVFSAVFDRFFEFKQSGRFFSTVKNAKSVNVLTRIDQATSRGFGSLRLFYDYFSELSHPNYGRKILGMCRENKQNDKLDTKAFLKDFLDAIKGVLVIHGRLYSEFEHLSLLMEYFLRRVCIDKTPNFAPGKLDHFGSGSSQKDSIYFLFCSNPFDHVDTQKHYLRNFEYGSSGNKEGDRWEKKELYEDAVFKYDKWYLRTKKIWFRVPSIPVVEYLQGSNDTEFCRGLVANRLKSKSLSDYMMKQSEETVYQN